MVKVSMSTRGRAKPAPDSRFPASARFIMGEMRGDTPPSRSCSAALAADLGREGKGGEGGGYGINKRVCVCV